MVHMMTYLTDTERAALTAIADDPLALGVHDNMLRSLARKALIRDLSDGNRVRWELTGSGTTVAGRIEATPSADPFTGMPDDDADPFTIESDRRF